MSSEQRADDRLIMLISRWLARHIGNAELERGLAESDRSELAPGQLEAVDELAEHLKTVAPGQRGELGDDRAGDPRGARTRCVTTSYAARAALGGVI